ncbi:MAG: CdaR family protein [Chloroflexota bacterium]
MQTPPRITRALVDNAIWFAGSLVLAFFVWVIATFQSDPIQQARFPGRVDIRMTPDAGLLIISPSAQNRTASLVIRAPKSVYDLLSTEEIEVWADLSGLGPGEHTVELQARLARPQASVIDISPSLMRLTLEAADQRQIPLRAVVTNEPPAGYSREEPVFDVNLNQVLVSGPASKVDEVVAAQVSLDLGQQRNPYQADMKLSPVDADGNAVADLTLDPQIVHVTVAIRRRDDVREIAVRPTIDGTPPDGYVLNALSYDPQVILVSGSPTQLANLPETLSTQPISLTDRTTNFEVEVPVVLPDNNLLVLSGQNVTVSVEISTLTASREFDAIPVEVLGLPDGHSAHLAPSEVTVLLTGPQPQLDPLQIGDIRVSIDLNGLKDGTYTLKPTVSISQGQLPEESISVLPAEIDVDIAGGTATLIPTPQLTLSADG